MKKLKNTKIVFGTLFFILFLIITKYTLNIYSQNKRDYYLSVQTTLSQTKYKTHYKYFRIMASDIYAMYSQNKKLIKLLSKTNGATKNKLQKIRSAVYLLLKTNYKRLHNMGISQVHFYLPNNASFLRMHKLNGFGKDINKIKKSVSLTNSTKKFHEGFEACPHMLGLRFIYPLYDYEKNYIGSVEISYSTKQLLENLTNAFVYDSHILVSKSIINNTIIEKELKINYKNSWESKDYYIEEFTHKKIGDIDFFNKLKSPKLQIELNKKINSKLAFSTVAKYKDKNIILSFLPMFSIDGHKNISYIVTYTESNYLNNVDLENNYISILITVVIILLYLFSIYITISQEHLKKLALYDNLTELPNRTLFTIKLKHEMDLALRHKSEIALMFIDLDGFKAVNDIYGHQIGDELLIKIAKILTNTLRKTDLIARMGGDEFTAIISDINDVTETLDIANNIIKDINKDIIIKNKQIHVGASIGISLYPKHCDNIEDLIKYADRMMYRSKEAGKNRATIYTSKEYENV